MEVAVVFQCEGSKIMPKVVYHQHNALIVFQVIMVVLISMTYLVVSFISISFDEFPFVTTNSFLDVYKDRLIIHSV